MGWTTAPGATLEREAAASARTAFEAVLAEAARRGDVIEARAGLPRSRAAALLRDAGRELGREAFGLWSGAVLASVSVAAILGLAAWAWRDGTGIWAGTAPMLAFLAIHVAFRSWNWARVSERGWVGIASAAAREYHGLCGRCVATGRDALYVVDGIGRPEVSVLPYPGITVAVLDGERLYLWCREGAVSADVRGSDLDAGDFRRLVAVLEARVPGGVRGAGPTRPTGPASRSAAAG